MQRIFLLCRINGIIKIFVNNRMIILPDTPIILKQTIHNLGRKNER